MGTITKLQTHIIKMKRILAIYLFFAAFATVNAQQLANYTLYRDHWTILNPAAMTNNYILNELPNTVNASYHRQWGSINDGGAPTLQNIGFQRVAKEDRIVFGGYILNDKTGLIGNTGIYGNFAYRILFGRRFDQSISIGLSAGLVQYRAKITQIAFADPENLTNQTETKFFPDFSMGIFYHFDDKVYAGLSIPQTFGLNTEFRTEDGSFSIERTPHIYAIAGAYFDAAWLGNDASFFEPSIWLKYVPNSPLSLDLNGRYQHGEVFWVGLGGGLSMGERIAKNAHFETGVIIGEGIGVEYGHLKIGVGFDWFFAPVATLGNGFEVMLSFSW